MKKYIIGLVCLLSICLIFTGCEKEEKEKEEPIDGGWEVVLTENKVALADDELAIFENATKNYNDKQYDLVALLGEQVVACKNYMYLTKEYKKGEESKAKYKVVVVYNDLQNKSSVTSVSDFNINKYAGNDIEKKNAEAVGAWSVTGTGKALALDDEKVQSSFDKAIEKYDTKTFNPIGIIGKQIVAGTNYAVLTYVKENDDTDLYVATLYVDLQGNSEITYLAYINLADFNK